MSLYVPLPKTQGLLCPKPCPCLSNFSLDVMDNPRSKLPEQLQRLKWLGLGLLNQHGSWAASVCVCVCIQTLAPSLSCLCKDGLTWQNLLIITEGSHSLPTKSFRMWLRHIKSYAHNRKLANLVSRSPRVLLLFLWRLRPKFRNQHCAQVWEAEGINDLRMAFGAGKGSVWDAHQQLRCHRVSHCLPMLPELIEETLL